ncbi:mediator of RNA polymerase II transcription subunit 15a-like [Quercus robur]|uniref:mediator of RNA polymerase II transcription subunit 15a-like n=1 Tax=Quercus robur TaxID=38942 RepID=UPI002163B962|nr:mediator of RNA polymerase II transcription subunit 15a-like [Quercus robur]
METLKRHHPVSGQEGLHELRKIAIRFEENIYTAATSQSDYLRKISLKMLTMEANSQNPIGNALPSNSAGNSNKSPDAASLDSTAQTGHANGADWQEEVYQKIETMKDLFLPEISEMYQKIAAKLQQHDSLPQQSMSDQLEKLKLFKTMLERIITFLQVSKNNISPGYKEKLGSYEKQIVNFVNTNWPKKPALQQEEVYQKIEFMKDLYLPEINEMYQKIAAKLQQHDSLPQQSMSDQIEKLKVFKTMLERIITFLQVSKNNISPGYKEKLGSYEKQIVNFLNTNRPKKPALQQGQLPAPHMQTMQQPPQLAQIQSHENQMNPQLQSKNLQGSVPTCRRILCQACSTILCLYLGLRRHSQT